MLQDEYSCAQSPAYIGSTPVQEQRERHVICSISGIHFNLFLWYSSFTRYCSELKQTKVSKSLFKLRKHYEKGHILINHKKHQIILPSSHCWTKSLIDHIHRSELHAGTQATLAKIRNKLWPLSGLIAVRHVMRKCVICFKTNPVAQQPIMGDLLNRRIEPTRSFINTDVDYCGPLLIRDGIRKRAAKAKIYIYIAIFICMAVKAVHIEVVKGSDSDSFIGALRRFIGRKNMPRGIWSHNVKASNFGGIWEAAMKSFKYHFKRVVGNSLLRYEELHTISVQIESILNSRPLTPMSEGVRDLSVLTPGNFLVGNSLRSNSEPNLEAP
ncbi:hypothetical protein Trydic_g8083 [Trypoxylus dichotomus]